jgi:hypothetical protein
MVWYLCIGNAFHNLVQNFLFHCPSKNLNINAYKTILPVTLHLALRKEHRLWGVREQGAEERKRQDGHNNEISGFIICTVH